MVLNESWDLKILFGGDIDSPELNKAFKQAAKNIEEIKKLLVTNSNLSIIANEIQNAEDQVGEILSFITMWQANFYTDQRTKVKQGEFQKLNLQLTQIEQEWGRKLAQLSDSDFEDLLNDPSMDQIKFILREQREKAKRLLDPKTEYLLQKLQQDALEAWSSHYETISSGLNATYKSQNGELKTVSAGQALNLLDSIANPYERANLMESYENMWGKVENLSGDTINHLAGARLTDYEAHHYDNFLEYPLELNRMSKDTLNTMWRVVAKNKEMLVKFLNCKAKLLKLPTTKISWQDQSAPLDLSGAKSQTLTYDEAAEIIVSNFSKFIPKMGELARYAFDHRWIEAENRTGKQPGGFEISLPITKEPRIFLTFTGSVNDAATIGHELGHAFHTVQMYNLPSWRQRYSMNVAETASTFAETIINNANVENAKTEAERLTLLDAKMVNAVAMFMNIHARYIFETNFYTERQKRIITPEELNQMMVNAQKEAFAGAIDENGYHPHFWSSKLHFYIDDVPLYNFPYTFGYLFSLGIYAVAKKEGLAFEDKYIALLRDTTNMNVEELAQKHLKVNLTKEDFWQAGADLIKEDVEEYLNLSQQFI